MVADGLPVPIALQLRRFRCMQECCPVVTFAGATAGPPAPAAAGRSAPGRR
jgi:hypothetical protein